MATQLTREALLNGAVFCKNLLDILHIAVPSPVLQHENGTPVLELKRRVQSGDEVNRHTDIVIGLITRVEEFHFFLTPIILGSPLDTVIIPFSDLQIVAENNG